ncbi:dephospho-CoA kinase [Tessaracoccus palaemonis]|uniref:Dephospho-CoA kinase n=1 Tax=Tessaracoccus palaemonis TaxID=2829499 RepID=A0ABX8SF23_9ACTN|nr:dephospho-CoA kinase [Tessaracoccus palaemonis]QXT62002.1 dephospho-CoA kinase, long form [Tessaracoccus palaemonis]
MPCIALTGGIASGKSTVAELFRELGAVIIDSDVLAREVVEPGTEGLALVAERFGPMVLRPDGALDRARLGELIFADEDARADLNAIIHPRVRVASQEREAGAPVGSVVLHVIPLLLESGLVGGFRHVVVVDLPEDEQLTRLMERNGLTLEQAYARLRAQAARDERLAVASWVIDNSGSLEETASQVIGLWNGPIASLP